MCEQKLPEQSEQLLQIGRAYAALSSSNPSQDWSDRSEVAASDIRVVTPLWKHLEMRRQTTADSAVRRCMSEIDQCVSNKNPELGGFVKVGQRYLSFATKEVNAAWRYTLWRSVRNLVFRLS
jgi:hypothetical protein